jgi:hypothetical protein
MLKLVLLHFIDDVARYVASTLQGVSHEATGEKATLGQLTKVSDEVGHTTYFPVLLLHACHQSIIGG